jgi:AcrR family transcriptional regulator
MTLAQALRNSYGSVSDTIDIWIPWVSNALMATRLRRVEAVERNRGAVLTAARRVFLDKGYGGATLEAIAEEAGFSKGVMYSQFESKADLFLTLLEQRIEERARQNERIAAKYTGLEGLRRMLEVAGEDAAAEAAWARVLVEFRALASRDLHVNMRYAAAHARTVQRSAAALERLFAKAQLEPRFPPRVMAEFILAFASGATLETAANPAALPFNVASQMLSSALGFIDPQHSSTASAADPRARLGAESPNRRRAP